MATRVPPYTAVVRILPDSRSAGTNTTDGTPAAAEWAATELARLPVDAQANRSNPSWRAAVSATVTTRSLNESVGLDESSFTHSRRMTGAAALRPARHSAGQPGGRRPRV